MPLPVVVLCKAFERLRLVCRLLDIFENLSCSAIPNSDDIILSIQSAKLGDKLGWTQVLLELSDLIRLFEQQLVVLNLRLTLCLLQ